SAGHALQSRTGQAFRKGRMRIEKAVYGGELSGHHYFRDFACCDSGMITWLLVAELISLADKPLSQLVSERQQAYPCSGEINFKVADVKACIHAVKNYYVSQNPTIDETDGVSMDFGNWRMNIRGSNTEPLLRLNIETKADSALVQQQLQAITPLLLQTA